MKRMPRILVVAGRDPSGAGLDADRDAMSDLAIEAHYVATAETDQDDAGVRSIGARAADAWLAEARDAARSRIDALKFGLLPGTDAIESAARLVVELRRAGHVHVVVDPVIAASSGTRFLAPDDVEVLRGTLLGLGVIVTPNLPEAAELARVPVRELETNPAARVEVARLLTGLGATAVVLKGGHGREDPVRDLVLESGRAPVWFEHRRTPAGKLRGSGCRFATRLAAELALGQPLTAAARSAGEFVAARIAGIART